MVQISAGYETLDMTTWVFPVLNALHRVPDNNPGWIKLSADDNDPYAHASYSHDSLTAYIRLIGSGFGDFDAKGVPHSGTVEHVVLFTVFSTIAAEFSGLALPVGSVLAALGSQSPSQLTDLLTSGDDVLIGLNKDVGKNTVEAVPDHLLGGAGNDLFYGHGGHDTLEGGAGNDQFHTVDSRTDASALTAAAFVDGGPGADTIDYGDAPFGVVVDLGGGAGTDRVINVEAAAGGAFADTLRGDGNRNFLYGGRGADTLSGGAGGDYLEGDEGADRLDGGADNDVIAATLTDVQVDGGDGDDQITVARDRAEGPPTLALVSGGAGDDQVTLQGLGSSDFALHVDGGAGTNLLWIGGAAGDVLDVYLDQTQAGPVIVADGFSLVAVDPGGPSLHLHAGASAASATTRGAQDQIWGGAGGDVLSDLASPNATGQESIFGGAGDDRITAVEGAHYLRGDEGNDSLTGGAAFDDINGNMGNDTAHGGLGDDWVVGGKDNDVLFGEGGGDIVYGNLGDDTCDGGDGADLVRGGQGNDTVSGGDGDDWLSGDRGNDTISGGAGADIFHTFGDAGIDRVLDFSVAQGDRVQLDPGTQYTVAQVGADTVISMTGGGQMILVGVQASTLPTGWIFGS